MQDERSGRISLMQLNQLTLTQLASGIAEGRFTSRDVTQACLEQIHRREAQVQAWTWIDADRAIAQATAADRQPLLGLPIGIKDIMATEGIPTGMGSPIFADYVPSQSATVVQRLEAAGGFCLGKTVTTEFAWRNPGKTRNPHNLAHTPGGSSSGSAAAVAAHFVPAALGTQTLGSVIRPAAFCGVVGYKPTAGLIDRQGVHPCSPTLDQVGVFTRSVADAYLLAACLIDSQEDSLTRGSLNHPSSLKLAAVKTPHWQQAETYQQQQFLADVTTLQQAGAEVNWVDLPPLFAASREIIRTILMAEAAPIFQPLQQAHPGKTSPFLDALITDGLAIAPVDYQQALANRSQMLQQLGEILASYDAILTLAATGEAPVGLANTGSPIFCEPWNLCGVPALVLPAGWGPQGLPLGLQVVGAARQDLQLLAIAHWCEAHLGDRDAQG